MASKAESIASNKTSPSGQHALPASTGHAQEGTPVPNAVPHHSTLATICYLRVLSPMLASYLEELGLHISAKDFVREFLDGIKPRDPMEELLAVQALLAHIRVLRLTVLSSDQSTLPALQSAHEYADRASNTFRRLMLALHEYRKPPRTPDSFTAIKQANIAQQQVVQNGKSQIENTTNEQGCQSEPPALPADSEGPGFAEILGQPQQAVGAQHRAANG
jgi:hypothetical protein